MVTLSRPRMAAAPKARPSAMPGFSGGGTSGPQERIIRRGEPEKLGDIDAGDGGGHQAERRQHRIAAADAGDAVKNMPEALFLRPAFQR